MINIAIDGPAGAGKSTIAKAVAGKLGIIYLDTGAMYRSVAYLVLKRGADVKDEAAVAEVLSDLDMDIRYEGGAQQIYVNGENVTPYLRAPHMSKAASDVSALPVVRYKMVELQREFARTHDVVLDGRDIGTFVLP
ncbi:MAG TPA: (d)CMP kinase, partial [Candidatus Limadaptatus stercorigallinarum]|nr:(d)CMP kinase [Candidatus Limadaptatus stercorigallinarum]